MKKILNKKKISLIIFYLVILVVNLLLVSIQNYDNIILQNEYDFKEKNHMKVNLEYYQMLDNKSKIENSEEFIKNTSKVIIIPSAIFLILFLVIDIEKIKLQNVFLILGGTVGLLYVFIVPIGGIPDENAHWYKSYEVSLGHMFSDKNEEGYGGRVMNSKLESVLTKDYSVEYEEGLNYVFEDSIKDLNVRYNEAIEKENKEEFIEFSNTAIYPAVSYIPQALGISVSRMFSDSLRVQAYSARLFNFIVYMLIMYFAFKVLPKKKNLLFLVAFLPISMQQAASMSLDGLVMATATYLIAYVLSLVYPDDENRKINIKDICTLSVCAILVSITKVIYLPLCLIIFLIPKERFKNVKIKYIVLIIIIFFATICDLLVIGGSFEYKNRIAMFDANTKVQIIDGIIKNPVQFVKVSLATIKKYGENIILEIFGKGLSWQDVDISPIYILSLIVLIIYEIMINKNGIEKNENCIEDKENDSKYNVKIKKDLFVKLFFSFVFLSLIAAVFVTEYVTINSVGSLYINGIQGRYFVPLIIMLGIIFSNDVIYIKNNKGIPKEYLFMFLLFVNLHALTYIMFKYL